MAGNKKGYGIAADGVAGGACVARSEAERAVALAAANRDIEQRAPNLQTKGGCEQVQRELFGRRVVRVVFARRGKNFLGVGLCLRGILFDARFGPTALEVVFCRASIEGSFAMKS